MDIPTLDFALASRDGIVTGMSNHVEKHPLYGTDSYALRMEVMLNGVEQLLAAELMTISDITKTIRASIRSWAAQLGLAGFNAECMTVELTSSGAIVETLVSDISNEENDILMQSLRNMADKKVARISRLLLLPEAARSGQVAMPLHEDVHYRFDRSRLSPKQLEKIWRGKSGREAILAVRQNLGPVPKELAGGTYLVGKVEANTRNDCWVIEPVLLRRGQEISALHDQSCFFDPKRTNGGREVEVRITGHSPQLIRDVSVLASVYTTNLAFFDCNHTAGV